MLRLIVAITAAYHRACIKSLMNDWEWHLRHGADPEHPHMKGIRAAIAEHDAVLVRLGYLL